MVQLVMFTKLDSRKVLYAVLGLVTLYTGCSVYRRYAAIPNYKRAEAIPVETEKIEKRFLARKETFSAKLQADESVTVISEVQGRVKELNLKEGQFVTQGTVLVQLENAQQVAHLRTVTAEYERAEQHYQKAKKLAAAGDIPQNTLKDAETTLNAAKAKRDEAQSAVDKMTITAPFDGVLGIRQISTGAFVHQNTEITKLNKLNPLRVHFSVPVDRMQHIILNNTVQVTVGDDPLPVPAVILAKESNLQSYNHLLDVVATLDNSEQTYIPGQFANVTLVTSQEEEVVAIPESSIVHGDNDQTYGFIVKNDIAIQKTLDLGARKSNGYVEVTNLEAGVDIVLNVGGNKDMNLRDGAHIKLINNENT